MEDSESDQQFLLGGGATTTQENALISFGSHYQPIALLIEDGLQLWKNRFNVFVQGNVVQIKLDNKYKDYYAAIILGNNQLGAFYNDQISVVIGDVLLDGDIISAYQSQLLEPDSSVQDLYYIYPKVIFLVNEEKHNLQKVINFDTTLTGSTLRYVLTRDSSKTQMASLLVDGMTIYLSGSLYSATNKYYYASIQSFFTVTLPQQLFGMNIFQSVTPNQYFQKLALFNAKDALAACTASYDLSSNIRYIIFLKGKQNKPYDIKYWQYDVKTYGECQAIQIFDDLDVLMITISQNSPVIVRLVQIQFSTSKLKVLSSLNLGNNQFNFKMSQITIQKEGFLVGYVNRINKNGLSYSLKSKKGYLLSLNDSYSCFSIEMQSQIDVEIQKLKSASLFIDVKFKTSTGPFPNLDFNDFAILNVGLFEIKMMDQSLYSFCTNFKATNFRSQTYLIGTQKLELANIGNFKYNCDDIPPKGYYKAQLVENQNLVALRDFMKFDESNGILRVQTNELSNAGQYQIRITGKIPDQIAEILQINLTVQYQLKAPEFIGILSNFNQPLNQM
ncbi:UNKNOWN [Stylonychia lemnae]|uniref:Uncharacterized protein n=1 Tax=Stylonychia lemnae TaxID=5949 RepID=A0A078AZ74_STYLE|nr:UNKNOWN [Stylonychia lemnae]|eukprot:CDW87401.1 UNKNOWN [Stylonychia lemnae]